MKISLPTEQATLNLAAKLAKAVTAGAIIYLEGELGAGKTTFTRGFLQALGYCGKVKSPTYTLVEPYEVANCMLYHFDLYRLTTPDELKQLGLEEYFLPDAICLIEWPERGLPLLPGADLICEISFENTGRTINISANTTRGAAILNKISC